MSLQGIRKELREIKREYAPNCKTIDELLYSDPHTLTNDELFRVIQHFNPEFKTIDELTTEILEKMVKGEYP